MKIFFKQLFASMLGFMLGAFVLFILFFIVVAAIIGSAGKEDKIKVAANSVLHIELKEKLVDRASKNPLDNFSFTSMETENVLGLKEVIENIEKAKKDANIKGIYLDLTGIGIDAGIGIIEEVRNALLDFKKTNKFIVSYGEVYTQKSYYLASVSDHIYLNPEGLLEWKGLHTEILFFKEALEKLEVEPQIIRYGKYKSAVEPFIQNSMSEENRQQMEALLNSIWQKWVENIAQERKTNISQLNELANGLLVRNAEDAFNYKLVDKLAYKDEVLRDLKKRTNTGEKDELKLVKFKKYFKAPDNQKKEVGVDKIAVIYASGSITGGEGDDLTIGSERLSKTIREARKDEKVKAIVLRVNSPGGSALASEVIWREVKLAKQEKPVVVSMGDLAASGGYYISCAADKIIANPTTITGSIGVFGVIPNVKNLLNHKLGIYIDTVKTNKYSDFGSITRPLTAEEKQFIQKEIERIYNTFVAHVAEGRNLSKTTVDSIGQGRVWSGTDALKIGLVDELGGLEKAIEWAAKLAKTDNYRVISLPKQKDLFEQLASDFFGDMETRSIKRNLGESYVYYQRIQEVLKMRGIQARMLFDINIY